VKSVYNWLGYAISETGPRVDIGTSVVSDEERRRARSQEGGILASVPKE
jgi:hypothetical protein